MALPYDMRMEAGGTFVQVRMSHSFDSIWKQNHKPDSMNYILKLWVTFGHLEPRVIISHFFVRSRLSAILDAMKIEELIRENELLRRKLEVSERWMKRQIQESLHCIREAREHTESRKRFDNFFEDGVLESFGQRMHEYF